MENYNEIGIKKVNNKRITTFILAILAGMFIAFAGYASIVGSYTLNNTSLMKLISALIFPIGLIFVVLFKTELFTGNSLLVIPYIDKKIKLKDLLINWLIVFIGNLIGAVFISVLLYFVLDNNVEMNNYLVKIATNKCNLSFLKALVLGFLCNILVCLAVFGASKEKSTIEKIFMIFIPIFTFIICSFEHSIANMFYLTIGYLNGFSNIGTLLLNNLLPVTIGNILGGVFISIGLYYINKN